MKMLTVAIDESYAKAIDSAIASSKAYSSRSEFLKDAIRKNLSEMLKFNVDLRKIHEESEKLAMKARARGFSSRKISVEERERIAREFAREKKIR